jgi:hypothetical protein
VGLDSGVGALDVGRGSAGEALLDPLDARPQIRAVALDVPQAPVQLCLGEADHPARPFELTSDLGTKVP